MSYLLTCSVAFMSARKQQSQDTLHMVVLRRGWSSEGPKTIFYPVRIVSVPTGIQLVKNLKLVKEIIKVGIGEK